MEKEMMMEKIEEIRLMMINSANEKGFLHPSTIEISQRLDKILNKFFLTN